MLLACTRKTLHTCRDFAEVQTGVEKVSYPNAKPAVVYDGCTGVRHGDHAAI